MKKVIAILMVAVMLFSFAACNKDKTDGDNNQEINQIDKEELKQGWQEGVLTFANGASVTLPCSVKEIMNVSGLSIPILTQNTATTLAAGLTKSFNLVDSDTTIAIKCQNDGKENINLEDAMVVGYSFNRTKAGNSKVLFANTLSVNAKRTDVEEVLGVDEKAEQKGFSKYQGQNSKGKKVEMRVNYDSNNLVNSVAFEIK